jgi:uncharacterized metal-binding protein YceD (DUF177 family)
MRVDVLGLPRNGRTFEIRLDIGWCADAAVAALEGKLLHLEGTVEAAPPRTRGRVEIQTEIRAKSVRVCDRCSSDAQLEIVARHELLYVPLKDQEEEGRDIELGADQLDVSWYQDGELDLATVVQESLALALPNRVVCADREACNGRLQSLLGETAEAAVGHPAFAALRDLN